MVKAYPALSETYGEVSCVAGVEMGESGPLGWIRLYPVPFRALEDDRQFAKYQPLRVSVHGPRNDLRPETRRPDRESIELVGSALPTTHGWRARRAWIEPLMVQSMCELRRRQSVDRTSLGIFRPAAVEDLLIEPVEVDRAKQDSAAAWAAQGSIFDDPAAEREQLDALELMPFRFKYVYRCDDAECRGHNQSITDWEIFQFYRRVRKRRDWQDLIRAKFLGELCGPERDTAFVVGNQHQHRDSFLVLSVWWPPLQAEQLTLGDFGDL